MSAIILVQALGVEHIYMTERSMSDLDFQSPLFLRRFGYILGLEFGKVLDVFISTCLI